MVPVAYDKGLPVVEFDSGLYSNGADITEGKDPTIGSVAQDSYSIGAKAVKLAIAKLEGKEVADVGIGGQWYNKDNIDELKGKNIFYMG